jgi:hypothetical protein
MAIPAELLRVASTEALAFLDVLGVQVDADGAAEVAGIAVDEYALANLSARLTVVDRALRLVDALRKAIETGEIPAEWDRSDRVQQLVTTELSQYDPRIAFQATLRSTYSAGRYQRGMESIDEQPYFIYRTMNDGRVRSSHKILNGVCLPKTHKFFDDHFTPNGWRCRCKIISADQKGVDRLQDAGVPLQFEPPEEKLIEYKDQVTGKAFKLPESIEPGWDFNPGTAEGPKRLAKMLERRMQQLEQA